MRRVDYLIVGSGLTGAVLARRLADAGREVLIVDRRPHHGGNVHDHAHPSGIPIHTYGPHYFRTSSDNVWEFATRFGEFDKFEASILSSVDGELVQWPMAASYIRRKLGANWTPGFSGKPSNFEEASLAMMPQLIYEKFIKEYNEKQWGVSATLLSVELCGRFDVREDDEPRLKPFAKYQGIPKLGYTAWMKRMIDGLPLILDCDYLKLRGEFEARKFLIFTGPIDEFFSFEFGKLAYRGQRRTHMYLPDVEFAQPCAQVNNPTHAGGPHIRTLEWKRMLPSERAARLRGTVLTTETPFSPENPGEYEYPFPDVRNGELYSRYRTKAESLEKVLIAGRLGEYRYYDMDQAIARAMVLANRLLKDR